MAKDKTLEELEAKKLAAEKAEAERLEAEKAEAERLATEKAEAEKLAAKKGQTGKQPEKIKEAFKAYPYHKRMYLVSDLVFVEKKYAEEYASKNKIDAKLIKEYLRDE
ncbi:MAG: hypothetical protein PHV76_06995 [Bacteroidales bacterium]|nr:hypothetical protein [Bacteroidales bacterium]